MPCTETSLPLLPFTAWETFATPGSSFHFLDTPFPTFHTKDMTVLYSYPIKQHLSHRKEAPQAEDAAKKEVAGRTSRCPHHATHPHHHTCLLYHHLPATGGERPYLRHCPLALPVASLAGALPPAIICFSTTWVSMIGLMSSSNIPGLANVCGRTREEGGQRSLYLLLTTRCCWRQAATTVWRRRARIASNSIMAATTPTRAATLPPRTVERSIGIAPLARGALLHIGGKSVRAVAYA